MSNVRITGSKSSAEKSNMAAWLAVAAQINMAGWSSCPSFYMFTRGGGVVTS